MNRNLYAHWLDPEYLTWRATASFDMRGRYQKIETLLKMHAVLGDCIRLSDVQLTDSLAVLSLFNDQHFRLFVADYPDFLSFRSRPATRFKKVKSERLAAILSGLDRAYDKGWSSSTFKNVEDVKNIAAQFKSVSNEGEAAEICRLLLRDSKYESITGLLHGLRHFCQFPDRVVPCRDSGSSYHDVLEEVEALLGQDRTSTDKVHSTLAFIKKNINAKQRYKRTPAILALHEAGLKRAANRVAYFNIIQAWNIGVSNTLRAHRDEAPAFPMVDPLPLYFGEFREAALETNITLADQELLEPISQSNWHPAQLTWQTIRQIRGNEQCRARIAEYQERLTTAKAVRHEFHALTDAVASALAGEKLSRLEKFAQVTAVGRDIGNIVSCFGLPLSAVNPIVGFTCLAGARVVSLPHDAARVALWARKKKSRREIAAGIRDYAIRFNLHRWEDES